MYKGWRNKKHPPTGIFVDPKMEIKLEQIKFHKKWYFMGNFGIKSNFLGFQKRKRGGQFSDFQNVFFLLRHPLLILCVLEEQTFAVFTDTKLNSAWIVIGLKSLSSFPADSVIELITTFIFFLLFFLFFFVLLGMMSS